MFTRKEYFIFSKLKSIARKKGSKLEKLLDRIDDYAAKVEQEIRVGRSASGEEMERALDSALELKHSVVVLIRVIYNMEPMDDLKKDMEYLNRWLGAVDSEVIKARKTRPLCKAL